MHKIPKKHKKKSDEKCAFQHGFYHHYTQQCIYYYWIKEVCISIAKKDGEWYLDDNRYYQDSYGCAYSLNKYYTSKLVYEKEINNISVWEKLFKDKNEEEEKLFPIKYSPV